jgi:hypothetical protein
MAYTPEYRVLLRGDRDDAARAREFDEWRAQQSPAVRMACEHKLGVLKVALKIGDHQAKALLHSLIVFCHMPSDEQDLWRAHGETVRASFEWYCFTHGISMREEVDA